MRKGQDNTLGVCDLRIIPQSSFVKAIYHPIFFWQGAVAIAGAGVRWLRDGLCIIKSASEVEELVRQPLLRSLSQIMLLKVHSHSQSHAFRAGRFC
jgi:hypothetical protein